MQSLLTVKQQQHQRQYQFLQLKLTLLCVRIRLLQQQQRLLFNNHQCVLNFDKFNTKTPQGGSLARQKLVCKKEYKKLTKVYKKKY